MKKGLDQCGYEFSFLISLWAKFTSKLSGEWGKKSALLMGWISGDWGRFLFQYLPEQLLQLLVSFPL
jgi:hypothetical protein